MCALVGGLLWPAASFAQEAKVEELFQELFLGESVYPQDAGELQFTTGYFWAHRQQHDSQIPILLEYGITDYFQVGVLAPYEMLHSEGQSANGIGSIELEAYWNFYNNPCSGWALGAGMGLGLPPATSEVGEDAWIYEPFLVVYKTWGCTAINVSGGVEIEDPREADESTETSGEVAAALIHAWDPFVFLLEADVEIESEGANTRIAPGVYWQPCGRNWEWGVSLPVGLSGESADIGVFTLLTFEFGGEDE